MKCFNSLFNAYTASPKRKVSTASCSCGYLGVLSFGCNRCVAVVSKLVVMVTVNGKQKQLWQQIISKILEKQDGLLCF